MTRTVHAHATLDWFEPVDGGRPSGPPTSREFRPTFCFPVLGPRESMVKAADGLQHFSGVLISDGADGLPMMSANVSFVAPELVLPVLLNHPVGLVMEGPKAVAIARFTDPVDQLSAV
jgi:hypothetical protein